MSDINSKLSVMWKVLVLCLVSAAGNTLLTWFVSISRLPLFLDTLFTVAVTMSAGFLAGLCTAILLYPLVYVVCAVKLWGIALSTALVGFFFIPCVIIEISLVWIFRAQIRMPQAGLPERRTAVSFFSTAAALMLLAAIDCILISVSGGIIDALLFGIPSAPPQNVAPYSVYTLKLGLLRANMPLLGAAILARIPINIVDRFIIFFGAYGVSILYGVFLGRRK